MQSKRPDKAMEHPQLPVEFGDAVAIAVSRGEIFMADSGANQIILLTPHSD
jgi:hypothetical protein